MNLIKIYNCFVGITKLLFVFVNIFILGSMAGVCFLYILVYITSKEKIEILAPLLNIFKDNKIIVVIFFILTIILFLNYIKKQKKVI
ncbi:MAG: hypothetical protein NTU81_03595 [Candidatus Nomurabacteria bacterium]|nr:hypothetical protein [Candidatus Nomurabacteria bacterium]